ncbi:hypothetical protein [Marinitoga aeolica]|uniref:Invasin domain-containing protein n=1 Tax=Marinitoga aeolica TaxID=2809031 RepID=A0ABY8PNH5_9BACT|nr:hypothetical protein [Marinitoga aeolica]WGS64186.1 hypothetical protein JRV97_07330 [Marinitoga aeolica]
MKKILTLIMIVFSIISFGRLNNIFINYNYDFFKYDNSFIPTNIHSFYAGYDFGNVPLKLQVGSYSNLQPTGIISTFARFGKLYIEPYIKYDSMYSIGVMARLYNFYLNYNLNKNMIQYFGIGLSMPIIKFGKDKVFYINGPNYLEIPAGKKENIKLIATYNNLFSENVNIFYSINDEEKVYAGKTNEFGEIKITIPAIYKAGKYSLSIFADNNKVKEIQLNILPEEPSKVSFDFDKNVIFTDNEYLLKLKNIKVYDKYSNEIKKYNIKFWKFKILGDYREINYSYLNNSLILVPFKNAGIYDLYFETKVNDKYINGIKTIEIKNNPKNIKKIDVKINYLGKEGNYAIFEIKNPKILFSNAQEKIINNFGIFYNKEKIQIYKNKFKVPINENFPKTYIFEIECTYYNYNSIIKKTINIKE